MPGSSVTLDFTEAFGAVQYSNRTISLVMLCLLPWEQQYDHERVVRNLIHGQKMHIVFDEDDSAYFNGRISVDEWEYYRGAGRVKISIDCDPWRYIPASKSVVAPVNWSTPFTATFTNNGLRDVIPVFYVTGDAGRVVVNGSEVAIPIHTNYTNPAIVFEPGDNVLTLRTSVVDPMIISWTEVHL